MLKRELNDLLMSPQRNKEWSPSQTDAKAQTESNSRLLRRMSGWAVMLLVIALLANQVHSQTGGTINASGAFAAKAPTLSETNSLPTMEVNKAVMVTVELDFGPKVPSVAEGLREIERRYQPDDGQGRTFAILDAYGEPTPDGKKLHLSMHISTEKPGVGKLVFRRTGEVLWQNRIVTGTNASEFTGKNLLILLDDGHGRSATIDGSRSPKTILDAMVKEAGVAVNQFWPDGAEREMTFIYSACGCPVKAKVKRNGTTTARTSELPVMFPDDPSAMVVINRLMGW